MATKQDLINMTLKHGNIVEILNYCLTNEEMTNRCKADEKVQKRIKEFFNDITRIDNISRNHDERLREITMYLIFKHKLNNEEKIRNILNFLKIVLGEINIEIDILKQLVKLLIKIEKREKTGYISVYYKVEMEKFYDVIDKDSTMTITTNNSILIKKLFEYYFKKSPILETETLQTYFL